MIIGRFVSLLTQRLAATFLALWVLAIAAVIAMADALPDSTWVALKPIPHQGPAPLFALAVDPSNNQKLIAGTSDGSLLRSTNGGGSWTVVHSTNAPVIHVAFDPYVDGVALAGTRGSGAFITRDGGASWTATPGLEGRSVRVFAFALTMIAAGTDRGVYVSQDGGSWTRSSLTNRSIDALAVEAIHAPVRLVAGTDSPSAGGNVPLFQSEDGGATWTQVTPAISGSFIVKLAAGPLPPIGDVRPLLLGTNTGLFASADNGATFNPLSGGGLLPSTDYTQAAFLTDHFNDFYVASDGGGSGSGGLWRTDDAGQTFVSLEPPQASVTALAVSTDQQPTLYVATFRPSDHAVSLWAYRDTGGIPQGPPSTPGTATSGVRQPPPASTGLAGILSIPQLPYIGLGLGAVVVMLSAIGAHLHGRRR